MKTDAEQLPKFKCNVELLQPWSTFVMKLQLPPPILEEMLKITDEIIANPEMAKSAGPDLVGQIEQELYIKHEILERGDSMEFFLDITRQFVIQQMLQMHPLGREEILKDEWYAQMQQVWIISQKDNEYNPVHEHRACHVSTIMYLKIPEFLPSRKPWHHTDGAITFISNVVNDQTWGTPSMTLIPEVGDFYIFPASQNHFVYPFRTSDGKGERRSVSFNAVFSSKDLQVGEKESIEKHRKNMEEHYPHRARHLLNHPLLNMDTSATWREE